MWSQDFLRVLHGAGKVAEQVAKLQVPAASEKSSQLARHANELARIVPYLVENASHAAASAAQPMPTDANSASPLDNAADPMHGTQTAATAMHDLHPLTHAPTAAPAAPSPLIHDQVSKEFDKKRHTTWESPFAELDAQERKEEEEKKVEAAKHHAHAATFQTVQTVLHVDEPPKSAPVEKIQSSVPNTSAAPPHFAPVQDYHSSHPAWKERHVPSSPLSRILGFGSLAAKLAVGTATEIVRTGGKGGTRQALISDSNTERLVDALCTMRGAALKLGQMLSIQDENLISPKLAEALDRVRQNAHVMPQDQLHAQLAKELGEDWRDKFEEFDDVPIAAASIGQVHRATLATGERVAVKIQYPGVADSIESDLTNLKRLVTYTNILPKGLYIDEIIRVGQEELTAECNYAQEAENQEKFRHLIHDVGMDDRFIVPKVHREVSTARVLATELISGVAIDKCANLSQELRDSIGRRILELTVRELFDWRFMQTDPNWSNFMYNSATDKIGLVDFGAAREYPEEFVNDYFKIVWAAANNDEKTLVDCSIKMNFLTGDESPAMIRAHTAAGMVVGEPFRSHEPFDFYESQLTKRLAQYTETFMDSRLTAPPQEAYSLHRKLAGAFLICIKLRARVPCRDVLEEIHAKYATPNNTSQRNDLSQKHDI